MVTSVLPEYGCGKGGAVKGPPGSPARPEGADPVDDRPDNLRRVVPHPDVLKPERVDIPQAPDQLRCAADDPARDRHAAREHVLLEDVQAERVERVDSEAGVGALRFLFSRSSLTLPCRRR